ncbi:MAG: 4Fe-4S dicluster domain-containing protein [Promethearchaeota archaeon]
MVDFKFRNELIREDFSLNYCYQCGTCSSSCPVAFITNGEYNPRKIIEQSLLGLKDLLLKDQVPNVWLCCTCQMCVEECPQNVFLTEIFEKIKNRIVELGESYPEVFKQQAKTVIENGVAIPLSQPIIRRRDQLGLPNIESVDIDELKKLLDATGFKNKVKIKEESK